MGRLKGSKNKLKVIISEVNTGEPLPIKRGRGRPRKTQTTLDIKEVSEQAQKMTISVDIKEIKRQIRTLRKIKKDTRIKTDERRELNEKIRELKEQLLPIYKETSPEKEKIIAQILTVSSISTILDIDLNKFTTEELQKHYEFIKQGKNRI